MGWLTGWSYRHKITAQNGKVDANLTNFPAYFDLDDLPDDFFANIQSGGEDVRVTQSDGTTEEPVDLVFIDTSAKTGEIHLGASSLSSGTDTEYYVYSGNAGASAPAADASNGSEAVWANYGGVWHLEEDQAGTGNADLYKDSTSNDNHGDDYITSTGKTGKLGKGQEFDNANSDYVTVPHHASLVSLSAGAWELWLKLDETNREQYILDKAANSNGIMAIIARSDATVDVYFRIDGGSTVRQIGNVAVDTDWHHWAVTWTTAGDGEIKLFKDGVLADSTSLDGHSPTDTGNPFFMGDTTEGAHTRYVDGLEDEVRITSNILRDVDWWTTQHNNHNDTSTFWVVGSQEEAPAAESAIFFGANF